MSVRISAEEMENCRSVFAQYDRDQSGKMDVDDLEAALADIGEGFFDDVEDVVVAGKASLDFNDFVEIYTRSRNAGHGSDSSDNEDHQRSRRLSIGSGSTPSMPALQQRQEEVAVKHLDMLLNVKDSLQETISRIHRLREEDVLPGDRQQIVSASEEQIQFAANALITNSFTYVPLAVQHSQPSLLRPPGPTPKKVKEQNAEDRVEAAALHCLNYVCEQIETIQKQKTSGAVEYVEVGVNGFEDDDTMARSKHITPSGKATSYAGGKLLPDREQLAIEYEELASFTFEQVREEAKPLEGSEAFKHKAKEFPFFLFPITTICEQLDAVDDMYRRYNNQIGMNEFLLRKKCPNGKNCKLQSIPEHRLELTHPCYADPPCPHMGRPMHMRCFYHGDDETNASLEAQLKEMSKHLGMLDLSGFEMGDYGAQCVAFVLLRDLAHAKEERRYKAIKLAANHISPVGAVPALDYAFDLVHIDLSNNFLGYKGSQLVGSGVGPALYQLLQKSYRLTYLNLSRNRLGDGEAKYIAEGLRNNVILKHIDLRKNEFGPVFGFEMAAALNDNRDLSELLVGWNRLEASGSLALLAELQSNSTLEMADLSWIGINEEGAKCVAKLIAGSMTLKSLNLSHNSIGRSGAMLISKALTGNKSLNYLDLSFNPIGDRAAVELVRELRENFSLEFLDIRCVRARNDTAKEINHTLVAREGKIKEQRILFSVGVAVAEGISEEPAAEA